MYNTIHTHVDTAHAASTPFPFMNTIVPATAVNKADVAIADKPTIVGKVFFFNC
jgi:hypothetical protein